MIDKKNISTKSKPISLSYSKNKRKNPASHSPWKEAAWILLLFTTVFVFVSLLTYNHGDPSFFTQSRKIPSNFAGRLGSNLSEAMIQLLGICSFLFCISIFAFLFESFKKKEKKELYSSLAWRLLGLVFLSGWLDLSLSQIYFGGRRIGIGGILGHSCSEFFLKYLNPLGAHLALIAGILIAVVFSTKISVIGVAEKTYDGLRLLIAKGSPYFISLSKKLFNHSLEYLEKRKTEKILSKKLASSEKLFTKNEESPIQKPPANVVPLSVNAETEEEVTSEVSPSSSNAIEFSEKFNAEPATKKSFRSSSKKGDFSLPALEFLKEVPQIKSELDKTRLIENSKILVDKLDDFGIEGSVVAVRPGPVITMYEFKPGPGVKISQIATLADDLSLALSAQSVRIVAPIPGKNVVGIEIPNDERETVYLKEILSTEEFQGSEQGIPLAIGKDISGAPVCADLAKMPHLLIAGAPGAGKSVFINSLICSLLYKFTPNDMRLIMVDPKQLELNLYEGIPHLLLPVVDDPRKASISLKWAVNEMERRYKVMAKSGIRNLAGFNQKLEKEGMQKMAELLCPQDENGMPKEGSLAHLFEHDESGKPIVERMPFILVIIDEFADLMMVAPKDIETSVARLAQKARAAGIHLVIATQRPSVDVITGLIKANLPSRISFQVSSKIDSRTILDSMGAEKLLGQGDMLFIPPGLSKLCRIHGAYVNEDEIGKICEHWRSQGSPEYREEILDDPEEENTEEADGAGDELYSQAVGIVRELGQASASMIQRRLKVGYNRAARMIEAMEIQGIVGPADGSKPREVLY